MEARVGHGFGGPESPAGVCLAGCERLDRCRSELLAHLEDPAVAVAECQRECARLDPTRRAGLGELRACLDTSSCDAFGACLDAPPAPGAELAVPSLPREGLSPCERSCGAYGECLGRSGRTTRRDAGALELACLAHCVGGPTPGADETLASCGAQTRCDGLMDCVEARTVGPMGGPVAAAPPAGAEGPPCARACKRIAECISTSLDPASKGADRSRAEKACQDALCDPGVERPWTEAQLRRFADCGDRATSCEELSRCAQMP